MKKLLVIIPVLIIVLQSCYTPSKLIPRERIIKESFYDYSKYTSENFLITPNPYTGEFESRGEIIISIKPSTKIVKGSRKFNSALNKYEEEEYLQEEEITPEELLEIIVSKARNEGADALTNFRARAIYNDYYNSTTQNYIKVFDRYELRGFAIKRK